MATVTSKDGTTIAFDRAGEGPTLIVVDGALGYRAAGFETMRLASLPALLEHVRVVVYDRRGRGESSDTQPYALEREIEDIEALIDDAGGSAYLVGISSGAALALEAALALGDKVRGLVMYEVPYNDDEDERRAWRAYRRELDALLAADRRGDAVAAFMMLVGMPAEELDGVRQHPMWPVFEAVAPTLAYDAAAMGEDASVPVERASALRIPALVMDGGASEWSFMRRTADALATAIPHAQRLTLEGQTHEVAAEALAPVLIAFCRPEMIMEGGGDAGQGEPEGERRPYRGVEFS
ncbi:MAG TPA: alpha/beta hydrolase [Chloroflexi bacterium]|jgi:pimeloyl-ACP methyl ester carboxylesterase|nr:alpha/beta hydrolase [Chloroflexota bacterium]